MKNAKKLIKGMSAYRDHDTTIGDGEGVLGVHLLNNPKPPLPKPLLLIF
jgi:hypothetical protein